MTYTKPYHHTKDELDDAQLADDKVDLRCTLRDHGDSKDPEWVEYIAGLRRNVAKGEAIARYRQRADATGHCDTCGNILTVERDAPFTKCRPCRAEVAERYRQRAEAKARGEA